MIVFLYEENKFVCNQFRMFFPKLESRCWGDAFWKRGIKLYKQPENIKPPLTAIAQ